MFARHGPVDSSDVTEASVAASFGSGNGEQLRSYNLNAVVTVIEGA